jgi:hypothetical protein
VRLPRLLVCDGRDLSVVDAGRHLSGEAPFVNESGSSVLAANPDDVSGFTARLGSRRSDALSRSVLASSTAAALLVIAVGPAAGPACRP